MGRRRTRYRINKVVTERKHPRPTPQSVKKEPPIPEIISEDLTSTSGYHGKAKIIRSTDGRVGMVLSSDSKSKKPKSTKTNQDSTENQTSQPVTPVEDDNSRSVPTPPDIAALTGDTMRSHIILMIAKMDEVVNSLMPSYGPVIDPNLPLLDQHSLFIQMRQNMMMRPAFVPIPQFYDNIPTLLKVNPTESLSDASMRRVMVRYPCPMPIDPIERKQFLLSRTTIVVMLQDLETTIKTWYKLDAKLLSSKVVDLNKTNLEVRKNMCILLQKVMLIQHISRIRQYLTERRPEVEMFAFSRNVRVELAGGEYVGPPHAPVFPRKPNIVKRRKRIEEDVDDEQSERLSDLPLTRDEKEQALNYRVQFVFLYRCMAGPNSGNVNFWTFVEEIIKKVLNSAEVNALENNERPPRPFFMKTLEIALRVHALVEVSFIMNSRCLSVDIAKEDILKFATYLFDLTGGATTFPVVVPPQTFDPPVFGFDATPSIYITATEEDSIENKQNINRLELKNDQQKEEKPKADSEEALHTEQYSQNGVSCPFSGGIIVVQEFKNKSPPYAPYDEHIHYMDINEYGAYLQERQRLGLPMHWEIDLKVLFDGLSEQAIYEQISKYNLNYAHVEQIQKLYQMQQIQQMQIHYSMSPGPTVTPMQAQKIST